MPAQQKTFHRFTGNEIFDSTASLKIHMLQRFTDFGKSILAVVAVVNCLNTCKRSAAARPCMMHTKYRRVDVTN